MDLPKVLHDFLSDLPKPSMDWENHPALAELQSEFNGGRFDLSIDEILLDASAVDLRKILINHKLLFWLADIEPTIWIRVWMIATLCLAEFEKYTQCLIDVRMTTELSIFQARDSKLFFVPDEILQLWRRIVYKSNYALDWTTK